MMVVSVIILSVKRSNIPEEHSKTELYSRFDSHRHHS